MKKDRIDLQSRRQKNRITDKGKLILEATPANFNQQNCRPEAVAKKREGEKNDEKKQEDNEND